MKCLLFISGGRVVSGLLHSGKIQRPESGYDVGISFFKGIRFRKKKFSRNI